MPDGVLSDTLHFTVTSGLPAGAVQSWLFIKEISGSFFFFFFFSLLFLWIPDLFLLCSQTSSPLKSEWQAELRDLHIDPYNTQLFEYFHRISSCGRTMPERTRAFVAILLAHLPLSISQSFPGPLILICRVSWKQQESAPFRRDQIYPTIFTSILK